MVEHLLIGFLGAVLIPGAQVFDFDVVQLPNPLIHLCLERIHRRQICRDGVRCPNICGSDSIKRQPTGMDDFEHLQAVLTVGNPGDILSHSDTLQNKHPTISPLPGKSWCIYSLPCNCRRGYLSAVRPTGTPSPIAVSRHRGSYRRAIRRCRETRAGLGRF